MATDATGTPTALGIPKYNTAADSPSGKGFNAAMDAIDAIIQAQIASVSASTPTGIVAWTAAASAPTGWVLADGSAISRSGANAALFALIGTQYGVGDGATTFNVPNLKGRVPVGIDTSQTEFDVRGETGGFKTHTLVEAEIPAHTHVQNPHTHPMVSGGSPLSTAGTNYTNVDTVGGGLLVFDAIANATATNQSTGGGGAHNNLQPYITLHGVIKL